MGFSIFYIKFKFNVLTTKIWFSIGFILGVVMTLLGRSVKPSELPEKDKREYAKTEQYKLLMNVVNICNSGSLNGSGSSKLLTLLYMYYGNKNLTKVQLRLVYSCMGANNLELFGIMLGIGDLKLSTLRYIGGLDVSSDKDTLEALLKCNLSGLVDILEKEYL